MKGRWFYYWKKVQGRISSSDYIFISEEKSYIYADEKNHLEVCLNWAEIVDNSGSNNGFDYGFDDVDFPPRDWVDKKILSIKKEIIEKDVYCNFLVKTLLNRLNSGAEDYIACYDSDDQELTSGDSVIVQNDGVHKIYKKADGQLYFKPYGKEDRVSAYFKNDLTKVD